MTMVGQGKMRGALLVLACLLAPAAASKLVAVTGATGKLGRLAVQKLSARGISTRVLLRHDITGVTPSIADDASSEAVAAYLAGLQGVCMVKGEVTDPASVEALLEGCVAVLALHGARRMRKLRDLLPWADPTTEPGHSKQVNFEGVRNIIEAAEATGCRRVVRITGKGESPWSIFSILINGLGSLAKAWNYEGECLLRAASDVDYTIIRPGVMVAGMQGLPEGSALGIADDGGDLKVTPIPHDAIADLCLDVLDAPNAARATLCAMAVPEADGADTYPPLLAKVQPDRREFAPTLWRQHLLAVRVGGSALIALAAGLLAGAAFAARAVLLAAVSAASALLAK